MLEGGLNTLPPAQKASFFNLIASPSHLVTTMTGFDSHNSLGSFYDLGFELFNFMWYEGEDFKELNRYLTEDFARCSQANQKAVLSFLGQNIVQALS